VKTNKQKEKILEKHFTPGKEKCFHAIKLADCVITRESEGRFSNEPYQLLVRANY